MILNQPPFGKTAAKCCVVYNHLEVCSQMILNHTAFGSKIASPDYGKNSNRVQKNTMTDKRDFATLQRDVLSLGERGKLQQEFVIRKQEELRFLIREVNDTRKKFTEATVLLNDAAVVLQRKLQCHEQNLVRNVLGT